MACSDDLCYNFEDSGCCTATPAGGYSEPGLLQASNDAETGLFSAPQGLIPPANSVADYPSPQSPPLTLPSTDAFSSFLDPLAPQSFGVQETSYLPPFSTKDSDLLDV